MFPVGILSGGTYYLLRVPRTAWEVGVRSAVFSVCYPMAGRPHINTWGEELATLAMTSSLGFCIFEKEW